MQRPCTTRTSSRSAGRPSPRRWSRPQDPRSRPGWRCRSCRPGSAWSRRHAVRMFRSAISAEIVRSTDAVLLVDVGSVCAPVTVTVFVIVVSVVVGSTVASNVAVNVFDVAGATALASVGMFHVHVLAATVAVPAGGDVGGWDSDEPRRKRVGHDDVRGVGGRAEVGHRDRVGHDVTGPGGGREHRERHTKVDRGNSDRERVGDGVIDSVGVKRRLSHGSGIRDRARGSG